MPAFRKITPATPLFAPRFSSRILPRYDSPLPLWMTFPLIFAGVYIAHGALLRLPYYWDEAGYYIPAAFDFYRTGSLVPFSTLSNAHPPLPSIYLALWWKFSGFAPLVTRTAMCFVASLALLAVYRLAMVLTGRAGVAASTLLLTALYPVWFAQSTLAHADMFAAAATLWGLAFTFDADRTQDEDRKAAGKHWAAVACFSLAVLSKETAIVTPLALAAWEGWQAWQLHLQDRGQLDPESARRHGRTGLRLLLTVVPLLLWFAYYYHKTGFLFGNPEYLRYNATATLSPLRILLAFGHRVLHVTTHMNMFVPTFCMLAAMALPPRDEDDGSPRPRIAALDQERIYFVIVANLIFFSVMGGALLTRYLLPLYPLVLLICVNTFRRRVRYWPALVALTAAAFVAGLFVNPPYRFAPEDNLGYSDVILLHQHAIAYLLQHYHQPLVLTAWPVSDELTKPELGYVRRPVPVVVIDNFALDEIQKAEQSTQPYTTALIFSTKYNPAHLPLDGGFRNEAQDARFFGFHRDLRPDAVAHLLGGAIVWREERKAQWAAVLHFDRPQVASFNSKSSTVAVGKAALTSP